MLFTIFVSFIITQRLFELVVAKRNETWMKKQGAVEFGQSHYRFMVLIHVLFFIVYMLEVSLLNRELSPIWPILLSVFFLTQIVRVWALMSLGRFWNTKILVLPNAQIVKKGPYRFLKHPNYCVVTLELLVIPLMFEAYATALIFSFLNMVILSIRIPSEEKALAEWTEYNAAFEKSPFIFLKLFKRP